MRAWIKTKIVVKHFCTAMETFLSCGLICISAIVLFISYLYLSSRGLPHGPWMWPFLGINSFSDNKKLILFLKNLERKYGSIFRFRLGTRHVTVVGGLENIQHVLGQDSVQPYHHWSQFITKNHEPQGISIWICILHFFYFIFNCLISQITICLIMKRTEKSLHVYWSSFINCFL